MKIKLLFILLITFQPLVFGANDVPERPLYLDLSQPVRTRVENLMSLMTLEEKIAQMCQYVGLEHMRDAEKNITEEELLNGHARGFYKGLHSTGVERMVTQGENRFISSCPDSGRSQSFAKVGGEKPFEDPLTDRD